MKKLLLLLWALTPMIGTAQESEEVSAKGFEPQVKISYEQGIDADKNKSFGADFVAGYRFSEVFRLGVGVGVYWCEHLYERAGYNALLHHYYDEYRETACYFPVFANAKCNFIKEGKWRPYFSGDIGYAIFKPFSDYAEDNKLGVFLRPAFGVDCKLGKGALFMELGYKYQDRKFQSGKCGYSQLTLSIGYQF